MAINKVVIGAHCHVGGEAARVARQCRARSGVSARLEPSRQPTAFPRSHQARIWRRQHHAHHEKSSTGRWRVRLLRTLGIAPWTFQYERRSRGGLTLELMREKMARQGELYEDAVKASAKECMFTLPHTPVEAGHDRFNSELMAYAAHNLGEQLKISHEQLMALGRVKAGRQTEPFCMTVLALKVSCSRRMRS